MSDTELLLKEIEGLPSGQVGEILDFVGYLKSKAAPAEQKSEAKPRAAQTFKPMRTKEELMKEAADRAARERETGESTFSSFRGCLKDSPCFAGRSGEEIQQEMRDEWGD
jgi:hypothetical protein